ncbi:MAG: DUF1588 domain-containing protein [Fuerstiella sp.]
MSKPIATSTIYLAPEGEPLKGKKLEMRKKILLLSVLPLILFASGACAQDTTDSLEVPREVQSLINNRCIDCHGEDASEGDLRLDNISSMEKDAQLELMNKVQEQIFLGQMPPEDQEQPTDAERRRLIDWLSSELKKHHASTFEAKLRLPQYGNYVDHDKLFSGEIKDKPFSPARRWIVSPYIFHNKINDIFGSTSWQLPEGIVNPFHLPDISGIRYYDNEIVNGGHFLTMVANAKIISYAQLGIRSAQHETSEKFKADKLNEAIAVLNRSDIDNKEKNKAARILRGDYPAKKLLVVKRPKVKAGVGPNTPFDVILKADTFPTDEQITAAVNYQFSIVLDRQPSAIEMADCKALTAKAIGEVGNAEGLRRMLVAVLLQSDFLYRSEFGEGEADEHGRKKLTPREASFAIAYALTERGPDDALIKAASSEKLKTKDDYKREVQRLLSVQSEPHKIDPRLHTRSTGSFQTTELIKLRFFREFFGYSKAYQVFKDDKRFEGGKFESAIKMLLNDADLMVETILKKDTNVFNELLTSDQFYLFHNGNNALVADAVTLKNNAIKELLAKDWQTNPKAFYDQNKKLLQYAIIGVGRYDNKIKDKMAKLAKETADGQRTPVVYAKQPIQRLRTGSGRNVNRSNMFNIDHHTWSFEPKQPFKIPNRMGMLTHPVWLVAHSLNVSTDPVRRGKWIREKLLAGYVPDVPITVDAAIPDDHDRTLRQRVHGKTKAQECWKCHVSMNPLGYPFEMFDDFGRYRTEEELEYPEHIKVKAPDKGDYTRNQYKTLPLDTTGYLSGTGDENLDGEVTDAIDLITRLGKSDRVRQSIIRHTFRYFMGRNEMLSDSQTLIDADQAYLRSDGSFNAVIVSLLTSDSFMYRKEMEASK